MSWQHRSCRSADMRRGYGEDERMDLDRLAQLLDDGQMPLVRTDFASDEAWQHLVDEVTKEADLGSGDRYTANVQPVSDPGFEGITPETLAAAWPRESHGYVMLADDQSVREGEGWRLTYRRLRRFVRRGGG